MGANVTLFARNKEKLKQTLILLSNNGSQNHQCLVGDFDNSNSIKKTAIPNLDIITATTDLAASEIELASIEKRENRLNNILKFSE